MIASLLFVLAVQAAEPTRWEIAGGPGLEFSQDDAGTTGSPFGLAVRAGRTLRPWLQPELGLAYYGWTDSRPDDPEQRLIVSAGSRFSLRLPSGRPLLHAAPGVDLGRHAALGRTLPAVHLSLGLRVAHEPHYILDLGSTLRFWLFPPDDLQSPALAMSLLGGVRF